MNQSEFIRRQEALRKLDKYSQRRKGQERKTKKTVTIDDAALWRTADLLSICKSMVDTKTRTIKLEYRNNPYYKEYVQRGGTISKLLANNMQQAVCLDREMMVKRK